MDLYEKNLFFSFILGIGVLPLFISGIVKIMTGRWRVKLVKREGASDNTFKKVVKAQLVAGIVMYTITGLALLFGLYMFTLPLVLDLPAMVTNNGTYVEGTMLIDTEDGHIVIRDSEGEEHAFLVKSCEINKETYIKARYLPHLKLGTVLEVEENE